MAVAIERRLLLIDTHVWVWLMDGDADLNVANREAINVAAADGHLRLSAISIWEIAMLASRGKITLSKPVRSWIDGALAEPGPLIEPLSPEIALASCYLPGGFRSDPADQIIVATARVTGAILLTRDRRILDYAGRGYLTVMQA